jgi:Cellulase (glycosyl hydrolase family 5)
MEMLSRLPLSLLAAAALAVAVAAPASAAPGLEVAVQDDAYLLSDHSGQRAAALDTAAALGAVYVRANVAWASTAPSPTSRRAPAAPVYNFSRYDRLVDEAAARGLRVQLTLTGAAPAWATGARKIGVDRPDAKRFGAFAAQAAAHFRGRVTRYSIWNEPNWHGWLRPEKVCRRGRCTKTAARRYRALYLAGHAAIERSDAAAQVWIGETAPNLRKGRSGAPLSTAPLKFLREMTCRDGIVTGCRATLKADGYAHHPYEFNHSPRWRDPNRDNVSIGTLGRMRSALSSLSRARALRYSRGGTMPVYLTEFAYFSSGSRALDPARRASYTRQAFALALAAPGVKQLLYYQLLDPPAHVSWRSGLLDPAGQPHPVFGAVQDFVRQNAPRLARRG